MDKIDWTKYFDRIWCINYIPYRDRHESIKKEFDRIGISDHPEFEWNMTFDSPWYEFILNQMRSNNKCSLLNSNELKCAVGHYSCIKKSQLYGDNRILIIEDDSRFLRDIGEIRNILDSTPMDIDIILYDYFVCCSEDEYHQYLNDRINDRFCRFESLNSCGCYSLSKNAIDMFVNLYEQHIIPADNYISKLRYKNLSKAFSVENMSCQATYRNSMSFHNGGSNTIHNVYRKTNLDYSKYMMRDDGSEYKYGDFIIENN